MWKSILTILAAILSYISNRQLINAGKAEERLDVDEASNKAQAEAKQTVVDVNSLSNSELAARMRKWRKPK